MPCEICLREKKLTKHHLIPVSRHKNKKIKAAYSKEELKLTIEICRECHNQIHALISEKEMAENFNTFDKLLNHEAVARFTCWIREKSPASRIRVYAPAGRKRRR